MNRASRLRLSGYALIAVAAVLGYLVKNGKVSESLASPLGTLASLAFMAGAVLALMAILDRIKSMKQDRDRQ